MRDLNKVGFNHVCFAVDDLNAMIARLTAGGARLRNDVMDFHNRKLVFVLARKISRSSWPSGIDVTGAALPALAKTVAQDTPEIAPSGRGGV